MKKLMMIAMALSFLAGSVALADDAATTATKATTKTTKAKSTKTKATKPTTATDAKKTS